jgi:hypothetical protein
MSFVSGGGRNLSPYFFVKVVRRMNWKDVTVSAVVVGGIVACLALLIGYQKTADANDIFFGD